MAQVMFSFLGVCTYFPTFRDYDKRPDAPPRRMLLVNAGAKAIKQRLNIGLPIEPHTASVQIFHEIIKIDGPAKARFPIDSNQTVTMSDTLGFRIWVEGATGSFQENDIEKLPGLAAQLSDSTALPSPDPLVFNANPQAVSVYVDIFSGTLSAFWLPVKDSGMGITQLTIESPGDLVPVKFRQFQSPNEWTVWLRPGIAPPHPTDPTGIVVKNMPAGDLRNDPADFYLQYLAVSPIPFHHIKQVTGKLDLPVSPFTYGMPDKTGTGGNQDADPGCSNSHYP